MDPGPRLCTSVLNVAGAGPLRGKDSQSNISDNRKLDTMRYQKYL